MHSLYLSTVVKRTEHESESVDLPVLVPTLPYSHEFCVGTESERPWMPATELSFLWRVSTLETAPGGGYSEGEPYRYRYALLGDLFWAFNGSQQGR